VFSTATEGLPWIDFELEDMMRTLAAAATIVAVGLGAAAPARAQSKTITGEQKTVTATVEAIEQSHRDVTLKKPDGTYTVVHVPEGVERFSSLKIGDKVTARYYENVVLRLKEAGEADVNSGSAGVTPTAGTMPAGTTAVQRTITATITAIDQKVPSITFTGPNNWTYSSKVEDKKALQKVKVGDKVDITWTSALLVSFEEPKQ
jgi:hypothetical protein